MTNAVWEKNFARIHVALIHNISKALEGQECCLGTPIITLEAIIGDAIFSQKKVIFFIVFMDKYLIFDII